MAENNYMNFEELADFIWGHAGKAYLAGVDFGRLDPGELCVYCSTLVNSVNEPGTDAFKKFAALRERLEGVQDYIANRPDKTDEYEKLMKIINDVWNAVDAIVNGRGDKESIAFVERVGLITKSYLAARPSGLYRAANQPEQYRLMGLSKIQQISDEQIQYKCLGCFCTNVREDMPVSARQAYVMRANNKYVAPIDLYNLIRVYTLSPQTHSNIMPVFQSLETLTRREITAELSKDVPDLTKIQHFVQVITNSASFTRDNSIITQVNQIYDVEKLLMPNSVEYLSSMPDSRAQEIDELNARIKELQAQVTELQTQVTEKSATVDRLNKELAETKATLEDARVQNQTLNSENSSLRQANDSLGQTKTKIENDFQMVLDAAQRLKGGLFGGREVEEYKRFVSDLGNDVTR